MDQCSRAFHCVDMCHLPLNHHNYYAFTMKTNLFDLDTGEQPSDTEVEQLLDDIEKYALANHILWGVWGIISVSSFTLISIDNCIFKLLSMA